MKVIDLTKSRTLNENFNSCESILEGLSPDFKAHICLALLFNRSGIEAAFTNMEGIQKKYLGAVRLDKKDLAELIKELINAE